jgi:hypothetical protein
MWAQRVNPFGKLHSQLSQLSIPADAVQRMISYSCASTRDDGKARAALCSLSFRRVGLASRLFPFISPDGQEIEWALWKTL